MPVPGDAVSMARDDAEPTRRDMRRGERGGKLHVTLSPLQGPIL